MRPQQQSCGRSPGSLRGAIYRRGLRPLLAAAAIAGLGGPSQAQPAPETIQLSNDWPSLQELLQLPAWMLLQLSTTAEPLVNPLGGERSSGSWIQQSTLELNLSGGLNKPVEQWHEIDHWTLNVTVNHDAGDATYNSAIGALFELQQVAYPAGFYASEASIERLRGDGWFEFKAGVLPLNPSFVAVPALTHYVHSSFNNTLNISVVDLPINPYAALGGTVSVHPNRQLSLRYGLFDLGSTQPLANWLGVSNSGLPPSAGTAQFLQLDLKPSTRLNQPLQACRTQAGIVRRRAPCSTPVQVQNQLPDDRLNVGGFLTSANGNGVYGSLTLRSGLPLGLDDRVWIGASYSPDSSMVPAPTFVAGGLLLQGVLPSRPLDQVVLGIGRGGLSNQLSSTAYNKPIDSAYEGMLELGYRMQLNSSLNLQPTLQWIFNPSGAAQPVAGILAAGVQLQLNF